MTRFIADLNGGSYININTGKLLASEAVAEAHIERG